MIRLLLIILLLLPARSFGMQMIGFGAASCATQSFDVQNTSGTDNTTFSASDQWGQSFVAGVSGELYSVSFQVGTAGTSRTMEVRVGESANLTTYTGRDASCTVPAGAGYFECILDTRPTLTSSTTYYIGMQSSDSWVIMEGSATYANGQEFYELASSDWNFTGAGQSYDINFKTKMCDP